MGGIHIGKDVDVDVDQWGVSEEDIDNKGSWVGKGGSKDYKILNLIV
jgi:hypothetical protein